MIKITTALSKAYQKPLIVFLYKNGVGNLAVFGLHNVSFNTCSTESTQESFRNPLGSLKC